MTFELPAWPMFGLADDVRPALREARERGEAVAMATIVALDGGGPRPLGTQMTIAPGGLCGFLSGGCLEADVAGHAENVLEDGGPRRLVYGAGSPWPDIRLLCGARIELQLERITPDDEAVGVLLALTEERVPAVWLSDGRRRACVAAVTPALAWPQAFEKRFDPVTRLIVLGFDPTALAIASLGAQAGFETTLVRPKGPAEAPPLAGVAYRRNEPGPAMSAIGLDAWTAVAVATHEQEADHAALLAALPSPAFYVGALGARRRAPDRLFALAAAGLTPPQIDRLFTPIGLDLGGKAPFEIAVAVIGEILGELHARRSGSTSTASPAAAAGAPPRRRMSASAAAKTVIRAES
jgi:xanthine dehydrogenase accessory factor